MKTTKELCLDTRAGWIAYCEDESSTQFTEALEAWATHNAALAIRKGVGLQSDFDDLKQEYTLKFLEIWSGDVTEIGPKLKNSVHAVNRVYNPASSAVQVPRSRHSGEGRAGSGVSRLSNRGVGMKEMNPSTYEEDDYSSECPLMENMINQDEIDAVLKSLQDADPKYLDTWNKCIDLEGDPVAIRREYGDRKGNEMLETLRLFLISKTNIVEPNTVERGQHAERS